MFQHPTSRDKNMKYNIKLWINMNNKRSQLCLILAEPGVLVQTHWTQYIKKSFTISDKYARPVTMSWGTGQQFDFWDIYIAQKLKTVVYAYWLNGRRNYPTTTNKTAFESHTKMENKKFAQVIIWIFWAHN